jgi:hypothetical protein
MEAMEPTTLLEWALWYAGKGIPVFPLKEKDKIPLTVKGFKDASTAESTIRSWWQRWPNANIGIPTGSASGLAVVDIDPRHGGEESWIALTELNGPAPETPMSLTGGGGRHLAFAFLPGFRNSAGTIGPGIDTRGEGGYIAAPPSVHSSGNLYQWEASAEFGAIPLAVLPDWLHPDKARPPMSVPGAGNLNFAVSGQMKADGSPVAPGGRNVAAASLAGQAIKAGDSLHEVMRKLKGWNDNNPQPLSTDELERVVASVTRTHVNNHPAEEVPVTPESPIVVELKPIAPRKDFPADLLEPPGMVGEICAWINQTAIKPQPILTLANVLAFWGAVVGRKVRTPTDLRTNLYCLGVGESGCGKDHSRKCIKKICDACGLTGELLGGEEVSSDTAILSSVFARPSILFQFDEIGHMIAQANSKYAQNHQKNIAPTFTKLFSSANTTLIGREYANAETNKRKDIKQPNVCLYGTTVPNRLYDGLSPSEISDGFLGRMLVFQSNNSDPVEVDVGHEPVPESIVTMIQAWYMRSDLPKPDGNLAAVNDHTPHTIPFEPGAARIITEFRDKCRELKATSRDGGGVDALWSRAVEHARKIALTVACGVGFQTPIVSPDIAEWSVKLVEHLVADLVSIVRDNVAGNEFERDLLSVQKLIRGGGETGVTKTQIYVSTRRLRENVRTEILDQLIKSGQIVKTEHKPKNGRSAVVFRSVS